MRWLPFVESAKAIELDRYYGFYIEEDSISPRSTPQE